MFLLFLNFNYFVHVTFTELKEDATYYVNDDENDEEQYLYTEADVQGN